MGPIFDDWNVDRPHLIMGRDGTFDIDFSVYDAAMASRKLAGIRLLEEASSTLSADPEAVGSLPGECPAAQNDMFAIKLCLHDALGEEGEGAGVLVTCSNTEACADRGSVMVHPAERVATWCLHTWQRVKNR